MDSKEMINTGQVVEKLEKSDSWTRNEIDAWVENNSDSGPPGVGWAFAFTHSRDPKWDTDGEDFDKRRFYRRLWRLAGDHCVKHDLDDGRIVVDFTVVEDPILIAKYDDLGDFQRGENGDQSVVFLEKSNGTWGVSEFCLRLAPPDPFPEDRTEVAHLVGDALDRVGVPAEGTMVWVRSPKVSRGKTPHVAGYDVSIPPATFLDWLSPFLEEWDDESAWMSL